MRNFLLLPITSVTGIEHSKLSFTFVYTVQHPSISHWISRKSLNIATRCHIKAKMHQIRFRGVCPFVRLLDGVWHLHGEFFVDDGASASHFHSPRFTPIVLANSARRQHHLSVKIDIRSIHSAIQTMTCFLIGGQRCDGDDENFTNETAATTDYIPTMMGITLKIFIYFGEIFQIWLSLTFFVWSTPRNMVIQEKRISAPNLNAITAKLLL